MEKRKHVSRRWRTAAVLAIGVAIGTILVATPAGGHIGRVTHLWGSHIKPRADDRYLQRTIQAQRTVRGTIGNEETVAGASIEVAANASLPGAAPFDLDDEHVTVDGTAEDTGQCNGTVSRPTATAGWVCIYLYYDSNVGPAEGYIWGGGDGDVRWGFQASAFSEAAGPAGWFGTWAYKAPANAPARINPRTSSGGGS